MKFYLHLQTCTIVSTCVYFYNSVNLLQLGCPVHDTQNKPQFQLAVLDNNYATLQPTKCNINYLYYYYYYYFHLFLSFFSVTQHKTNITYTHFLSQSTIFLVMLELQSY